MEPRRRKIAKRLSAAATTGDTFPTIVCGVAYGSGPTTDLTTATFTDEVTRLKSGNTSRGRSNELDAITTSSAKLLFVNSDRHFDSAYNTDIAPLLPVRVSAVFNNTTEPLFTGYATGFPQTYAPPNYAESNVACVDALEVIRSIKTLGTPWETQSAYLAPDHWYRLSDTTAVATDTTGNKAAAYVAATAAATSLVTTDTNGATAITAPSGLITLPSTVVPVNTTAWTIGFWVNSSVITDGSLSSITMLALGGYTWAAGISAYTTDNLIEFGISNATGTGYALCSTGGGNDADTTGTINDGVNHHMMATRSGTTISLYIDGALASTADLFTNTTSASANGGTIGTSLYYDTTRFAWSGTIDELQIWETSALTAAQVADLYNAGANGWNGDTTGQRIGRYLDAVGWPAAMRDLDAGYTTMDNAGSASDAMAGIQAAVKAEAGLLYVSPMGKVVFRDRFRRLTDNNSLAPLATFGDGGGTEYPYFHDSFVVQYDRDRLRTSATGNRAGGPTLTSTDTGNRAGVRTEALGELQLRTDAEVRGRLEYVVDRYKTPTQRVDSIVIRPKPPEANDTWALAMLWSIILNADLSQQLQVIRRPQSVGSAITLAVLIERVDHVFAPFDWRTVLALSPADTKPKFRWNISQWDTTTDGWSY